MVVLHVKSTTSSSPSPSSEETETEFLHECAATAAVADMAAALAGTTGLQSRVLSLYRRLRERCTDAGAAGAELERALSEAEAYGSKVVLDVHPLGEKEQGEKDPNKPKCPLSAFFVFIHHLVSVKLFVLTVVEGI